MASPVHCAGTMTKPTKGATGAKDTKSTKDLPPKIAGGIRVGKLAANVSVTLVRAATSRLKKLSCLE